MKKSRGFSLVELSVTFVVVGLMTGAAIWGMKVKEQAELNSVVSDVRSFTEATSVFQSIYGFLPGDIPNVDILPKSTNAYVAGNGNGIIEPNEALQFWTHLAGSGLVKGRFNAENEFSTNAAGDGASPASPLNYSKFNSGFKVASDPKLGVKFIFSGFDGSGVNDGSVLPPSEAAYLDDKFDDGNPLTGKIRAEEGSNSTAGSCVNAGQYARGKNPECVLTIYAEEFAESVAQDDSATVKCDGSSVGATRVSTSNFCEHQYVGRVIESCTKNGTWEERRRFCSLRKCIDGQFVGQNRELSCPPGQKGTITQICGELGVYKTTNVNCAPASTICSQNGKTRKLPCSYGQKGKWEQRCDSGTWQDVQKTCVDITCAGSVQVGEIAAIPAYACPNEHDAIPNIEAKQVCTIPQTGTDAVWTQVFIPCGPTYGSCNSLNDQRDIKCPTGQMGLHTQKCNGSNWETVQNTCSAVTCGGAPVGSMKISQTRTCPVGTIGFMMEICSFTDADANKGIWKLSDSSCISISCNAKNNVVASQSEGNAQIWPEAQPGESVNATNCIAGYSPQGSLPERVCDFSGSWEDATNPCIAACPAETDPNTGTIWANGSLNSISVINQCPNLGNANQCPANQMTPQMIFRECFPDGTWSAPFGGLNGDGKCITGDSQLCIY